MDCFLITEYARFHGTGSHLLPSFFCFVKVSPKTSEKFTGLVPMVRIGVSNVVTVAAEVFEINFGIMFKLSI